MVYTCIEEEKVEVMVDLVILDYIRGRCSPWHLLLVTTDKGIDKPIKLFVIV